ncbi:hypothetical protein [Leptospira ryugenii]|uniref:hypothetical protein n=1 Tax=Leptospira ryugenii TaxID=1917863 RepID=UPI0014355CC5|nr:hypothetical protein [Leptospira ryugenii]
MKGFVFDSLIVSQFQDEEVDTDKYKPNNLPDIVLPTAHCKRLVYHYQRGMGIVMGDA